MTLKQALLLRYGQTIYHKTMQNADGSPCRFRVSGEIKTWKRNKSRIQIPLKRGFYDNGYLLNEQENKGKGFSFKLKDVSLKENLK